MPGRKFSAAIGYRYGFNGKENDNEVKGEGNQQDYGMRVYDPRIAKFLSVDPITKDYPSLTPYQFASNNPTTLIDLDGLEGAWVLPDGTIQLNPYGPSDNLKTPPPPPGSRNLDVPPCNCGDNVSMLLDLIPVVNIVKAITR